MKGKLTIVLLALLSTSIFAAGCQPATPLNRVWWPRLGFPAFVKPGGSFTVELAGIEPQAMYLVNETHRLELKVELKQREGWLVKAVAEVPAEAGEDLYNLSVLSSEGSFEEPHSVYVYKALRVPFTVFWITDTHYDVKPGAEYLRLIFRKWIRIANFLKPDLVVITGDIVNNPPEHLFKSVYRDLLELEVPVLLVPGNHDWSREGHFIRYLSVSNRSLTVEWIHIVALDTGPGGFHGWLTREQMDWLEEDLAAHSECPVKLMLMHHPLYHIENRTGADLMRLASIAKRYNVSLILTGHSHVNKDIMEPAHYLVGASGFKGGKPYSGFYLLKLTPQGVEYKINGTYKPIPHDKFEIKLLQENTGAKPAAAAYLRNGWWFPVKGYLKLRLKKAGGQLKVEGGKLTSQVDAGSYVIAEVEVKLSPKEEKLVKAYYTQAQDKQPPKIAEVKYRMRESPSVAIATLLVKVEDDYLGVQSVNIAYTTDNRTWSTTEPAYISPTAYQATVQVEKGPPRLTVKIEVKDLTGKTSEKTVSIPLPKLPEEAKPEEKTNLPLLAAATAIAAAIALAAIYLLKRS